MSLTYLGEIAPEIVMGTPYDKAVDLWSVGVIMYVLLAGFAPFNDPHQLRKITKADYSFNYIEWQTISDAGMYTKLRDYVYNLMCIMYNVQRIVSCVCICICMYTSCLSSYFCISKSPYQKSSCT